MMRIIVFYYKKMRRGTLQIMYKVDQTPLCTFSSIAIFRRSGHRWYHPSMNFSLPLVFSFSNLAQEHNSEMLFI
jgi:hypothetical protein